MITTARSHVLQPFSRSWIQRGLTALYAAVWTWAALAPVSRADWLLENLLVFVVAAFLVWLYRIRPLSDVTSLLLAAFLILHTVGSHYTYSEVPLGDWMKDVAGLERNHYDRVVHFTFGLLITYPIRELFQRSAVTAYGWAGLFAFMFVGTASGIYELIEWITAAIVDPEAGIAFLGTQGDVFDSQKDHALALAGSIAALAVAGFCDRLPHRRKQS